MKQNGFTLIELLITIVIIAILAGIAVPQYLAYTKRAEVAELVALADIVKKKVGIFYSTKGRWPDESNPEDTEDIVGLDLVRDKFGVSSDSTPSCDERCARWWTAKRLVAVKTSHLFEGGPGGAPLAYTPQTSKAALTWSCTWYGEEKYPGAKPDGCEAYVAPSADDDA